MNKGFDIKDFLSLADYATEERVSRRKSNNNSGISNTNEFFTPFELVEKMANKIPGEKWDDPNADFLEPSFGNGQFVIYIIYNKIMHGSSWKDALIHTWGTELMEDNVHETHDRTIKLLNLMGVPDFDETTARQIMEENLVQTDFFKWDYDNWKPIEEEKPIESIELF